MSLHLVKEWALISQTQPSLCFMAGVFGSCCWQFIVIWLCWGVLVSRDCTVWSGKGEKHGGCLSSWNCFLHVHMFSMILFCVQKTEWNITLLVMQTLLPAMSHLCHVHTINTKTNCNLALSIALLFQFCVQDTSQTHCPVLARPRNFLSMPSMFFLSSLLSAPFLFLQWPPFCTCPAWKLVE